MNDLWAVLGVLGLVLVGAFLYSQYQKYRLKMFDAGFVVRSALSELLSDQVTVVTNSISGQRTYQLRLKGKILGIFHPSESQGPLSSPTTIELWPTDKPGCMVVIDPIGVLTRVHMGPEVVSLPWDMPITLIINRVYELIYKVGVEA